MGVSTSGHGYAQYAFIPHCQNLVNIVCEDPLTKNNLNLTGDPRGFYSTFDILKPFQNIVFYKVGMTNKTAVLSEF